LEEVGPNKRAVVAETKLAGLHVMSKARLKEASQVPPQLIGIVADAVAIGATGFRLEPNPPHTMASFSVGSQAMEIDFEAWSGREMMDFLVGQVTDPKKKTGQFELKCDGKMYACRVVLNRARDATQAEVIWA
jgi:hypothetical protein